MISFLEIIPVTEKSVGVFRDMYITDQSGQSKPPSKPQSLEAATCDVNANGSAYLHVTSSSLAHGP